LVPPRAAPYPQNPSQNPSGESGKAGETKGDGVLKEETNLLRRIQRMVIQMLHDRECMIHELEDNGIGVARALQLYKNSKMHESF